MKIPNSIQSFVPDSKITDYLLSEIHEIGKHKANFFKHFGFDVMDISNFRQSLIQHSIDRDIVNEISSNYGVKYILKCEILTPDNRNPCIYTVWIVEYGTKEPRLITAYSD